jgi:hypothetical protein
MLEILGSRSTLCDHLSRRAMLRVGALAPLGLSLPSLLAARDAQAASSSPLPGFGKAKRCLLLFMWGGPAHQDMWDMKPDAPLDVRGEFKPIASNVPGINVCEHLSHLSQQMDKLALVRSVTHTDNNHSTGAHWMLTGYKHRLTAENFPASAIDMPHIGSVITKLMPSERSLPTFVALPERIGTTAGPLTPGQFAGMLGKKYDPFFIDQHPDDPKFKVEMLSLRDGMDPVRVAARKNLLDSFNAAQPGLEIAQQVGAMKSYYERATDLVVSTKTRQAFDLAQEKQSERERYGMQTFGQSVLLARRLLEAGVKLVTVYWHRDKSGGDTSWDTHAKNFSQLKNRLIPQIDRPLATLLADLQDRGLLDDTLVVWLSEFGRTPKVNGAAGRDHWGPCNTIWFAGAGIPGGQVYGASDKHAAYPIDNPVTPADVTATIYHLLGIAPHTLVHDREGRPHTISHGQELEVVLLGQGLPKDPPIATPPAPPSIDLAPNPALLADKPLAYWVLGDSNGPQARDEVGASSEKPLGATPAKYQNSLPASDQRAEATVETLGDHYSVEFCFLNDRPFDSAPVTGYLVSRRGADVGPDRDRGEHIGIGGAYNSANQGKLFIFNGDDSSAGSLAGRTTLELGRWYHVVFTREGENVALYLNGQTAIPEIQGKLAKMFTTNHLFLATRSDALFPLQGRLHHVAVFHGTLPPERVAAHHAALLKQKS